MKKTVKRSIAVKRSTRVRMLQGTFDVPPSATIEQTWELDFELPADWRVGMIIGRSGSGKTTIAREIFGDRLLGGRNADGTEKPLWQWPADASILDGFPAKMTSSEIHGVLSSVGFSSQREWQKPFGILSNGEQFRVNVARTLAEISDGPWGIDEFGSFVQAEVRKVCGAAVGKAARRLGRQIVAVTCHTDFLDEAEPDWVLHVHKSGKVEFILNGPDGSRGSVRRWARPAIDIEVIRTTPAARELFKPFHYLSAALHPISKCFVALVGGEPAAFTAVLPFPHKISPGWREHRTVCLPEFQGIGIGNAMSAFIGGVFKALGKPYFSATSHPAMIAHRMRSPLWEMTRKPGLASPVSKSSRKDVRMGATTATDRITAGFKYVGPARREEARALGVLQSGHGDDRQAADGK